MNIPKSVLDRLPTPCLFVDLPAADRNIERVASVYRAHSVKLRPHFKAHKCTRLLHRQLEAGGCVGATCQTAAEALILADAGFSDVLLANQTADPIALRDLARAATRTRLTVAVDCAQHVELLAAAIQATDSQLGVVIELDVGIGRCGLPVNSEHLVPLAKLVERTKGLTFRGLQAYEGHVVQREDEALRRTMLWQVAAQARHERDRLQAAGIECELISGGGTGTWDLAAETQILTEVQAGSYVLMDAKYAAIGLPFEPALYVATRVISRRERHAGVLNAGLKETTMEYGPPRSAEPGVSVVALSDEHTRVAVANSADPLIGDVLFLIPSHIDPTINLHDALFVWDGAEDIERWPVDGRRITNDPS
ncbi:MAG: alanine racemase [Chloroflexota bacterium]|nr:alanine racemase [Chloroflexota bacterium]